MADAPAPVTPTAAPAALAPAAPAPDAKPSVADQVATEEAELAKQIQTATRSARSKKAAAKSAAKKAPAPKAAPAAAAAPEEPADEPEPAPAGDEADDAGSEPKPKVDTAGKSARELLEAGDIDAAFEAAFGKKPGDFNINAKRWAEWHKAHSRNKSKLESMRTQALAEVQQRRTEVDKVLTEAERTYGPMVRARKLYDAGDVAAALKEAFGDDLPAFQRKALASFHGKNPEVETLKRELRERDEREAAKLREQEQAAEKARYAEQETAYLRDFIVQPLTASDDPQLATLAKKPGFARRVLQIQRDHYDPDTESSVTVLEAADLARDEIIAEFGDAFGVSRHAGATAESVRAGSKPAQRGGHVPPTTLTQRGATEASGPTDREMTDDEQIAHFAALARQRQRVA
jgi:hypothetical protein